MTSPDERMVRSNGSTDGVRVRLSDGILWTLPYRERFSKDPAYDALLNAIDESEDLVECRRGELALTIFLLNRTYHLSPDHLASLLSFEPNDPALTDLQTSVSALAEESAARAREAKTGRSGSATTPSSRPDKVAPVSANQNPFRRLGLFRLFS